MASPTAIPFLEESETMGRNRTNTLRCGEENGRKRKKERVISSGAHPEPSAQVPLFHNFVRPVDRANTSGQSEGKVSHDNVF
jgi:hypothetical protein